MASKTKEMVTMSQQPEKYIADPDRPTQIFHVSEAWADWAEEEIATLKNLLVKKMQDNAELAKQIHDLADTFVVGATKCQTCSGLGVVLGDGEELPCPKCGTPTTTIRSRKDGWG